MSDIMEYKCPNCAGAIKFDSEKQKMKCPYCDTEFDVEALKTYDEALKNEKSDDIKWEIGESDTLDNNENIAVYVCKSCGGEIVGDKNTGATKCPFCDNPVIMAKNFSGVLKPDYVIPFKLDKKGAKEALQKHLKGKWLLPKLFKDENHIDEIRGIYVPFWLFGADADADMTYRATRVSGWSNSNYTYTKTDHYFLTRAGKVAFEHIPVDGSSKMEDDLMESIEPFNFDEVADFQTAYLAGYLADKYDVSAKESIERANKRVKKSAEDAFSPKGEGYATVIPQKSSIKIENGSVKYALYPVWILNTTWNGKKYTFAMNGQTGKFVGNLPMDKKKYFAWLGSLAAAFGALTYAVAWLINYLM